MVLRDDELERYLQANEAERVTLLRQGIARLAALPARAEVVNA